jgi:putative tryptophan/tyrosine transport system substrate-binding protein
VLGAPVKRRNFIAAIGVTAVAVPSATRSQQKKMAVIGWLHTLSADRSTPVISAFREGLREAGYIEGENIAIEYRGAEGYYDQLPTLATDLVGRKVDVILTGGGSPAALAAKNATSTIPIVFAIASDPVESGVVQSLARPEANVTGISFQSLEILAKRLQLLLELVPRAGVIGLLVNPKLPITEKIKAEVRRVSPTAGVRIEIVDASSETEIDAAFSELARLRVNALLVGNDSLFYNQRDQIADLAVRHSLPASYELSGFVLAGGLMSYSASLNGAYRQAAGYVGRILTGAKPGSLPVQQPTRFELVINMKTAKALDLTVPQSLLQRADEVIE